MVVYPMTSDGELGAMSIRSNSDGILIFGTKDYSDLHVLCFMLYVLFFMFLCFMFYVIFENFQNLIELYLFNG